ncbi:DUF4157 domain-containing protein [Streptomyces sp. NPDC017556]|uniref:DUF4157 domain-containing protein n=1 Tax=Streptomyces sp. NPDC017556 TaxID=3365002 RepID=UPI0037AF4143
MHTPARDSSTDVRAGRAVRPRQAEEGQERLPSGVPASLLGLQRSLGNAAVAQLIAREREDRDEGEGEDRPVQRAMAHQVLRSPGRPMQEPLRREMEGRLGADFSAVRIHADPVAQRSAAEVGARAYTSGEHVVVGDGGKDRHTLAHELTHVIQQRQGPVAGTDTGDGLRVSDPGDRFEREAEANASRVMAAPAPVQCAEAERGTRDTASASGGGAVVQRKGHDPLKPRLPAEAPPAEGLMSKLKALTRTQPDPGDVVMAQVRAAVVAYDSDGKRDPAYCMTKLMDIQEKIAEARTGASEAVLTFLRSAKSVVDAELNVVAHQSERDRTFPDGALGPYEAMTDTGMLWNREEWPDSSHAFGMKGASYFRELSELNRAGMAKEIAGRGTQDWVAGVENKLTTALDRSVLCHYTTASRAAQMAGGRMKSKSELLRENPNAENNSEAYDKHGLANEGFVFFFLEVPGSPFRSTRFSGGEEAARIEIPLTQSPLMSQGWLMLSDFAQRDYPTVRAKPEDPAQTQSKLPTRENEFSPRFSLPARKFEAGAGSASINMNLAEKERDAEQDNERRSQIIFIMSQVAADKYSTMAYGGTPGPEAEVYPEKLRSNTLMGSDIVPGLVERAVVEIQRLSEVNPKLADALKSMSGDDLMQYLLKDLLRPQAMLPNSVDLSASAAKVVHQSGAQPAAAMA